MSLDNVFEDAAKRRAESEREEAERIRKEETTRKSQTEKRRENATIIDKWLRAAADYLLENHRPLAKSKGYDIQHQFELTPTVPGQTYSRLHLYMQAGSVVHVFTTDRPGYKADHELCFEGDENSGDINVFLRSRVGNTSRQLESFRSEADLPNGALDAVFESFVKQSLELEDWRRRQA